MSSNPGSDLQEALPVLLGRARRGLEREQGDRLCTAGGDWGAGGRNVFAGP